MSEAQKQSWHELLWMLWFDEKSISNTSYFIGNKEAGRWDNLLKILYPFFFSCALHCFVLFDLLGAQQ